jgi:hypothetical protein
MEHFDPWQRRKGVVVSAVLSSCESFLSLTSFMPLLEQKARCSNRQKFKTECVWRVRWTATEHVKALYGSLEIEA